MLKEFTKTAALEVQNMRIVFHARKPTSKERKKEKERDVVVIVYFFVSVIILPVPSFFDDAFLRRESAFA
jgi:flagellar biosynthesis component FlhA